MVNWWVIGGVVVVGYLVWNYFTHKEAWDNIFGTIFAKTPEEKQQKLIDTVETFMKDPKVQEAIKKQQAEAKSHYSVRL